MIVNRYADAKNGFSLIGKRTGFCEHGIHYGNVCFDEIMNWYVYEEAKK